MVLRHWDFSWCSRSHMCIRLWGEGKEAIKSVNMATSGFWLGMERSGISCRSRPHNKKKKNSNQLLLNPTENWGHRQTTAPWIGEKDRETQSQSVWEQKLHEQTSSQDPVPWQETPTLINELLEAQGGQAWRIKILRRPSHMGFHTLWISLLGELPVFDNEDQKKIPLMILAGRGEKRPFWGIQSTVFFLARSFLKRSYFYHNLIEGFCKAELDHPGRRANPQPQLPPPPHFFSNLRGGCWRHLRSTSEGPARRHRLMKRWDPIMGQ